MSQLEAYLEMDSADEKMFKKMQLIREADAREIAKKQQQEIAKRKRDPTYQKDNMKSISSVDYNSSLGLGPAQIGQQSITSGSSGSSMTKVQTNPWQ